ncbi:MAG: ABC transporter ATP-binding protein [Hyphomicrobiales bacterium]
MLELENITKVVGGQKHIKETSFSLKKGHFNVLLGKTGSGKTSLIKLIAGLDPIGSGTIKIDGVDVTKLNTQERQISLVHQFFINYPHMTVFENIASPLRVAGMSKSEIEGRVEEAADILKMKPMLQRRPHELSGGQQQRTALARAIAKESKAVLLDEPLANLDYKLREELRELLPELFANRGAVVVYATSEPEEALLLGGETALMDDGYVRQFGPTSHIYRNPITLSASQIFSDPPINYAKVTKRGAQVHLDQFEWELPSKFQSLTDGDYQIAIRPHHILPYKDHGAIIPVIGRIGVTELSGSESSAHFEFGNNSWVSLAHGGHPYKSGEEHTFYVNPEECLFFTLDGKRAA